MADTYQILVKFLDGRTHCLRFPTATITGDSLVAAVSSLSSVPAAYLRLVSGRLAIISSTVLTASGDGNFPSAAALLRLRGGKGGFGSLLRGAASKAGQKKTSNFDACRDMSGRRLRHVNAERRLEEWKAEAGDRQLEKLAEDFIRKKAKEAGRNGGAASTAEVEKYLEKFRKDAEHCVGEIEESVRASLRKRKAAPSALIGADLKKLKIWLGKKVDGIESDGDSDEDDNEEDSDGMEGTDTKSVVLDDGNCSSGSDHCEEEKLNLDAVPGSQSEGESSGEKSQQSHSEGENGNCVQESPELAQSSGNKQGNSESDVSAEPEVGIVDETASQNAIAAASEEVPNSDGLKLEMENTGSTELVRNEPDVSTVETVAKGNEAFVVEEPFDLGKYSSAAELEVLGMERLKLELQSRGLKCGGTLQERAARLFLLKTTPLEKLPKKVLARPIPGGK